VLDQDAGNEAARLVRLRDITENVTSRRDIRRFHHAIRHKIRTPMNALLGGLSLLTDAPDMTGEEIAELATITLGGAERLQGALEDVFRYIDAPAVAHPAQGFALADLPALVAAAASAHELASPTLTIAPELQGARLTVTPAALVAILGEVLENAKKFHPNQQPTVEIAASRSDATNFTLTVTDDGLHLSPEQLARVWEQYYQGGKFFTGEVHGMGLGLPLVAALVWGAMGAAG
jgi:signal transduction histidine kinase